MENTTIHRLHEVDNCIPLKAELTVNVLHEEVDADVDELLTNLPLSAQ